MKVNEFVKKFGWDEAKKILNARRTWVDKKSGRELADNSFVMQTRTYECAIGTLYKGNFTDYDENSYRCGELNLLLLESLVKSHELVEFYNGLDKAKKKLSTEQGEPYYNYSQQLVDSLKQAIADVESCM